MISLGRVISANGSNQLAYERFIGQLRGSFHANSKILTNPRLGLKGRLSFWGLFVRGLGGSVMGIWTISPKAAARIEAVGNRLLGRIIRPLITSSDSNAELVQARHRIISHWRREMELSLTSIWAASLARWIHHVFRHSSSPPYLLLHCQSPE